MRVIEPDQSESSRLRCPHCGVVSSWRAGSVRVIRADEPPDMMALFTGRLESLACAACGSALDYRPVTLVKGFGGVWGADGSLVSVADVVGEGDLRPRLDGLIISSYRNLDEVRSAIMDAITPWLRRLVELTATDDMEPALTVYWDGLIPEVLVAFALWFSDALPEVPFDRSEMSPPGTDDADPTLVSMVQLGRLQALVLFKLIERVTTGGDTLQEALDRHVVRGVVLPSALERLEISAARVVKAEVSWTQRYVTLAVHAALCWAGGVDDPLGASWAEEYVRVHLALRSQPGNEMLTRLALRPETAKILLTFAAMWDATHSALDAEPTRSDEIDRLAEEAGFSNLVTQITSSALEVNVPAWADSAGMTEVLDLLWSGTRDSVALAEGLRMLLKSTAHRPDQADMVALYQHALGLTDGSDEARAKLLVALGDGLRFIGRPAAFLHLIGERAQPWERSLAPDVRASLWAERSSALRFVQHGEEALKILDEILESQAELHDDALMALELNRAILVRETGSPDSAAAMLLDLLPRAPAPMRLPVVESLMKTYLELGRAGEGFAVLKEVRQWAAGPWRSHAPFLDATIALLSANIVSDEGDAEAAAALERLADLADIESRVLSVAVAAMASLASHGSPLFDRQHFDRMRVELRLRVEAAAEAGARQSYFEMLQVLAGASEVAGEDARELWERMVFEQEELSAATPFALLALAHSLWAADEVSQARTLLVAVPASMAATIGGVADLGAAVYAHGPLERVLREVASQICASDRGAAEDLRLVAELQRDATGRARAVRGGLAVAALQDGLGDSVLAQLSPDHGALHVIEWFETVDRVQALHTTVSSGGHVDTVALTPPNVEIDNVARRLRSRLDGWTQARPGDPLDFPPWQALERWLCSELSGATHDDHVVFFDHKRLAGLPWHLVPGPWTSSYASSWSGVLTMPSQAAQRSRLGVLSVPAADDDPSVVEAFSRSLAATRSVGQRFDIEVTSVTDGQGDPGALRWLLASNDIVKLMCHGFVAPGNLEVGIMLAADGALPAQHAVAAASTAMAAHRFDWRDAQKVERVARIVMSAACSSGVSHMAGLNERLGLFSAWRSRGASALVAPAWDGIATDVLEVLDATLERFVTGGASLAECLRDACRQAENRLPRWRAWTLCLEGDWR
jgi:hypothetical protein